MKIFKEKNNIFQRKKNLLKELPSELNHSLSKGVMLESKSRDRLSKIKTRIEVKIFKKINFLGKTKRW